MSESLGPLSHMKKGCSDKFCGLWGSSEVLAARVLLLLPPWLCSFSLPSHDTLEGTAFTLQLWVAHRGVRSGPCRLGQYPGGEGVSASQSFMMDYKETTRCSGPHLLMTGLQVPSLAAAIGSQSPVSCSSLSGLDMICCAPRKCPCSSSDTQQGQSQEQTRTFFASNSLWIKCVMTHLLCHSPFHSLTYFFTNSHLFNYVSTYLIIHYLSLYLNI